MTAPDTPQETSVDHEAARLEAEWWVSDTTESSPGTVINLALAYLALRSRSVAPTAVPTAPCDLCGKHFHRSQWEAHYRGQHECEPTVTFDERIAWYYSTAPVAPTTPDTGEAPREWHLLGCRARNNAAGMPCNCGAVAPTTPDCTRCHAEQQGEYGGLCKHCSTVAPTTDGEFADLLNDLERRVEEYNDPTFTGDAEDVRAARLALTTEYERVRAERDALRGFRDECERQFQAKVAEVAALREDAARLDWLEGEQEREQGMASFAESLFRRNVPITREAIDAARSPKKEEK